MIASVLPFFRTRLEALGYKEWADALASDGSNIPATLHDRAYHLELGVSTRTITHQDNMHVDVPVTVRLFVQKRRDTVSLRDRAVELAEAVIDACVLAANRLAASGIHDIAFENFVVEPYGETNDNAMKVSIEFTALVVKSLR
jgi:hypothetical protein